MTDQNDIRESRKAEILTLPCANAPFADLAVRHALYATEDIAILCEIGGIGNSMKADYHTPYAAMLARLRQADVLAAPQAPLNKARLDILAGANAVRLFEQDLKDVTTATKLDRADPATRDILIERVLQDTSRLLPAVTTWLSTDNNNRFGHYMAQGDNAVSLLKMPELGLAQEMTGLVLFERINMVLGHYGLPLLASPYPVPPRRDNGPDLRPV
ncbi:MAG: hypothetical protein KKA05_08050 [Alphaproteobacteria bacterium]|nr:hypothetical protein [Alphaproteobacteria bacterium]MBU0858714.1 hypothetical protein [Alphaproteobacteria bacterium]